MKTRLLDYHLPPCLLATEAASPRDAARLMVIDRHKKQVSHLHVRDLAGPASPLRSGDLLVLNQTKVLPAAFEARRCTPGTGGKVGGLYVSGAMVSGDSKDATTGDTTGDTSGGERGGTGGEGTSGVGTSGAGVWEVMLESRGTLVAGEVLDWGDQLPESGCQLKLIKRMEGGLWRAQLLGPLDTLTLLSKVGSPPLPPYIRKARKARGQEQVNDDDVLRYNTVFADKLGSVAAPTAGLHFTQDLLTRLEKQGIEIAYVTLHVGMGTFLPVRCEMLEDHPMHSEHCHVSKQTLAKLKQVREAGGRIIPVGTTCVRTLESLPDPLPTQDIAFDTNLLIQPGVDQVGAGEPGEPGGPGGEHVPYPFRFADGLMTNFHLPRSTLLALVAALPGVGVEQLMVWYQQAIENKYRFYSYGDAMWVV